MPAVKGDGMRGLAVFISDIRNCKSKEAEVKRINKELANIRSKFKGDKTLDGYQKKKYVCKLLFIFLLGHDIDFGHMEAVNLLSSNKYTEKQIGYLFISVLVSAGSDLMKLVIQSIKNDLSSRNPVHINLALQCIANIGSREMADALGQEVPRLLVSGDTMDSVKQCAALCLLHLLRNSPDAVPMSEWSSRIIHLLNDQHMGVVTAAVSLIHALAMKSPDEYKGCVSLSVSRLSRIVTASYTDLQDYTYYFVPAPWLSIKLLRLLQNYPPPDDASVKNRLNECLETILNKAQEPPKSKKVQHSNAKNAVLFEAINLIIHMDSDPNLLVRACNQLGQFLQHRETNLRYLALEGMCLLATSEFSHDAVKKHMETVITALKTERDVSVRQRAVDLLYAMCDRGNVEEIVHEMLVYLEMADYSIREEMVPISHPLGGNRLGCSTWLSITELSLIQLLAEVARDHYRWVLKVAILAEKYAVDYTWYVDTILNLIRIAGDYVSEEVWYRVIQIVINRDDVQGYAAKTVFEALQAPACHENMVKVGSYILGEFGNLIAGDPRSSPMVQFQLLHSKFHLCSISTRQLMLSSYIKFINLFPEIKPQIQQVFGSENHQRNADVELQQRSVEYIQLSKVATTDVLATVLEEMPPFPERESSILAKLKKKRPDKVSSLLEPRARGNAPATVKSENQQTPLSVTPISVPATNVSPKQAATSDLLGLSAAGGPSAYSGILVDVMGDIQNSVAKDQTSHAANSADTSFSTSITDDSFQKFVCKNNGVLFENDLLQIGVKSEFRQNLGRLTLFYGNKTQFQFISFLPEVHCSAQLSTQLSVQAKPVDLVIEGGLQKQQLINIECMSDFTEAPKLTVQFVYNNVHQRIQVRLPVMLCKFIEPTQMDSSQFFQRWKLLSQPNQECQKIFKAQYSMDHDQVRIKVLGAGLSLLDGIDPNPDNFVCAGIVHSTLHQIGCLARLEPNKQANMYRLTIRASKDDIARQLCELLETQF